MAATFAYEIDGTEAADILNCTPQNVYKLRLEGKLTPTRWLSGSHCRNGRKPLYDLRQVWRLKRNGYGK